MKTTARCLFFIVASSVILVAGAGLAGATTWNAGLNAGSVGLAQSGPAPASAPTGVDAECTSFIVGTTVKVSWSAVTAPSNGNPVISYTVLQSTTSGTTGFSVVQGGVSGTSWTSGSLGMGHYWFEVAAYYGNNWSSPNSTVSAERTITLALLCT